MTTKIRYLSGLADALRPLRKLEGSEEAVSQVEAQLAVVLDLEALRAKQVCEDLLLALETFFSEVDPLTFDETGSRVLAKLNHDRVALRKVFHLDCPPNGAEQKQPPTPSIKSQYWTIVNLRHNLRHNGEALLPLQSQMEMQLPKSDLVRSYQLATTLVSGRTH
jgi:hypothetical protein